MGRKRGSKNAKKLPPPIQLDATSILILNAKISNPGATIGEIGEALNLARHVVGDRMREPVFKAALWQRLDPPEEYLRENLGDALGLLASQIKEGRPRKLANGEMTQVTDDQKERGQRAAAILARLGIAEKHELTVGEAAEKPEPLKFSSRESKDIAAALREVSSKKP